MERSPTTAPASSEQDWWWIFDPRLSLRARAALICGGAAIAFTLLVSTLTGALFRRSLERQAGAVYETLAFQMSDKLDRTLYQRQHELQLAAGLAPFRTPDVPAAERRRLLEALQESARDFAWIGFADAKGRVRAATRGMFDDAAVDMRPWFRVGRDRAYVGNLAELPALARELNQPDENRSLRFIDLAVPVQSIDGQFLGVIGAHIDWDWAREVQLSVVPEAARRDRIGVTVYSSGDVLLDSGGSGWSQPPEAPVINDNRRFRGSLVEATSGGGSAYVTGFSRSRGYREFRGLGWMVVVRQPLDLVLAPARELQRTIVGWGFAFCAAVVVASWIVAGRLAHRLRTVRAAADRIREGDILTVMPSPGGESELGRMCGSLDAMVESFRRREEKDRPS